MAETFTVPADSVIGLELEQTVSSETAQPEDRVDARVTRDVKVDGTTVIPAGSRVRGAVTRVENGGRFKDRGRIEIRFHTLVLADGDTQSIATDALFREGDNVGKQGQRADRRERGRRRDHRRHLRRREGRGDWRGGWRRRRHGRDRVAEAQRSALPRRLGRHGAPDRTGLDHRAAVIGEARASIALELCRVTPAPILDHAKRDHSRSPPQRARERAGRRPGT